MKYHKWEHLDTGIFRCTKCGIYRCHAVTDFTKISGAGNPRLVDVEYSTPDGEVLALNPRPQPECGGE